MGALKIAAVSAVTLGVLVQSMSSDYECGPYCPPENQTMNICVTTCPLKEGEIFDRFNAKMGRFRDGTPCWVEGEGPGLEGVCCDGECNQNKTACKSKMAKCRLLDAVKKTESEEAAKRRKRKVHSR
ncbi:uncharacterized protein LOC125945598 [Dermacentor silvarum]|uniref:uncharacterized protein LOC125945598 n=1 Tax=Dermacentor silvarum TaxID=543639 RepID=UPI00210140EB|nr:uncharacterized protein LOC125945598 [Dermacentor silvarum]